MDIQTGLFQFVGGSLENAANRFVGESVHRLIETIYPWAVAGLTIYLMVWGYMVMQGWIERPGKQGMLKAGAVLLISIFALNADTYLTWVMGTLQDMQVRITAAVTGREGETLYAILDRLLDSGLNLVKATTLKAIAASGEWEFGAMLSYLAIAVCIAIAFLLVTITSGIAIITAVALLKVLFAIGPFCIAALLFPPTAKLFEGWFGQVVTFILSVAMAACVVAISVPMMEAAVASFGLNNPNANPTEQNTLLYAIGLLGLGILLQSLVAGTSMMAARLGGGIVMATMNAIGAARLAMAPAQAAKQLINPTSYRLDPQTGHKVHGSRLEHIASGRTVVNPIYRRGLIEQMNRGWKPLPKPGGTVKKS